MRAQQIVGGISLAVGGLQLLANLATLVRGPLRVRAELQAGALSERFADLLSVSWVYGGIANLCIATLLIMLSKPLREGSGLAWRVATVVGLYYVLVGLATYFFGLRKHPGLLAFVLFGLALLVPLWAARAGYGR